MGASPCTRASLRQLWISPDTARACLSPENFTERQGEKHAEHVK